MARSVATKAGAVLFAVLLYCAIQFPSAWAGLQNPWGAPPSWHESGAWLYMTVHHVAQALLAVAAIAVLGRFRFREWGLNFDHAGTSLKLVRSFSVWFAVVMAVSVSLQLATGAASIYDRPLRPDHVLGGLFFMWIVSGVSEEILFRGLFQTWFARFWTGAFRIGGTEMPVAGVVGALFFALVHVNFSFETWEITRFSPMQVAVASCSACSTRRLITEPAASSPRRWRTTSPTG
jgi:membrane protease YdiL (CAAX protease family)